MTSTWWVRGLDPPRASSTSSVLPSVGDGVGADIHPGDQTWLTCRNERLPEYARTATDVQQTPEARREEIDQIGALAGVSLVSEKKHAGSLSCAISA